MKVIEGRKDSLLILPNGQVLSPRIFTNAMSMFNMYDQIEQFQLVQKSTNLLKVYVKQKKGSNLDNFEERLAEHLERMLRLEGSNVNIEVEVVEDMPRDQTGKHRAVYSELKP
jgi:phenylacetate-coenzyme A ligase PaaK-like adenylate-forming protein